MQRVCAVVQDVARRQQDCTPQSQSSVPQVKPWPTYSQESIGRMTPNTREMFDKMNAREAEVQEIMRKKDEEMDVHYFY